MIFALRRAIAELSTPGLRRIVGLGVGLAVASYVVLWVAVAIVLDYTARFGWRPLDWSVKLLGALAVLALGMLLRVEARTKTPILILSMFRTRLFSAGIASLFLVAGTLSAICRPTTAIANGFVAPSPFASEAALSASGRSRS